MFSLGKCHDCANLPMWIDKWIASFNSMPSNMVNIETPNASTSDPNDPTPPGTRCCHVDVIVSIGPQKNPNPKSGRRSRKTSPQGSEKSPGQISPKPTLNKEQYSYERRIYSTCVLKERNVRCQCHYGAVECVYKWISSSIRSNKTRDSIEANHAQND